jgi:hypothetical protein
MTLCALSLGFLPAQTGFNALAAPSLTRYLDEKFPVKHL